MNKIILVPTRKLLSNSMSFSYIETTEKENNKFYRLGKKRIKIGYDEREIQFSHNEDTCFNLMIFA